MRREALWLLSNIAAGTEAQREAVMNHALTVEDTLRVLVKTLKHEGTAIASLSTGDVLSYHQFGDANQKEAVEAVWVIGNLLTGGTTDQVSLLNLSLDLPIFDLWTCHAITSLYRYCGWCSSMERSSFTP